MAIDNDASAKEKVDSTRLLMEQAQEQLRCQLDFSDALDSKARLVLTSGSIVITVGSGFVGIGAANGLGHVPCTHIGQFSLPIMALGLYVFGLVLYALAVGLGGWAYFVRTYSLVPDPTKLVERYTEKSVGEIVRRIAEDTAEAFERNEKTLSSKAALVKLALGLFLCETLAVAASLFLLAIS